MISDEVLNFKRLRSTDIMPDFVIEHNGSWNHEDWLKFCELLKSEGFTPIDYSKVGAYLEDIKDEILENDLGKIINVKCLNCSHEVIKAKYYFVNSRAICPNCGAIITCD